MKKIIVFTAISLIFFGLLWKLEYATDTYAVFNFNSKEIYTQFASSGRWVTATAGMLVKNFNVENKVIYTGSFLTAIICCVLSLYNIYKIIEKDIQNKFLQILIPILIIINPFSIELFLFIEKGVMIFAILMCTFAIKNLIKYFETNSERKYLIYSFIFMLLANFSYQGVVGIFVAFSLIYILKYSKNIKDFIKLNLVTSVIYGGPALIDLLMVKTIYKSGRISGEIVFLESLKKIVNRNRIYVEKYVWHFARISVYCSNWLYFFYIVL